MQIFDYEHIDNESLDVGLEMSDGKVLFFNDVHFSKYDLSVMTDSMMDYYCLDADWNSIEYHPTIAEIREAKIVITNFLNDEEIHISH